LRALLKLEGVNKILVMWFLAINGKSSKRIEKMRCCENWALVNGPRLISKVILEILH
jgi:hypothetical protein